MSTLNKIILHTADSKPEMDIGAKEIDQWYKERGLKSIGYHFVIRKNGEIESGRPIEEWNSW